MKNINDIKRFVEDQINYHCEEFGLTREEVTETVMLNCIEFYYADLLSKDDLLKCSDYLEYEVDIDTIEKEKAVRQKRKEQRKARALKKTQLKGVK